MIGPVPVSDLHTHPALQLRDPALIQNTRARTVEERAIAGQRDDLARSMRDNPRGRITPLDVADVKGKLWITDGHQRWEAAKIAGRSMLPCRVQCMTWADAMRAARRANTTARALPLATAMKCEAAWRDMGELTGWTGGDPGQCAREIAGLHVLDRKTTTKMRKWLVSGCIVPDTFPADKRDPETGWPYYSAACEYMRKRFIAEEVADDPELDKERQACLLMLDQVEKKRMDELAKFPRRVQAWAKASHLAMLEHEARRWRDACDDATDDAADAGDPY